MNQPYEPSDELLRLLAAVSDETATEADWASLETILLKDHGARRFYLRYMNLGATLQWEYASAAGSPDGPAAEPTALFEERQGGFSGGLFNWERVSLWVATSAALAAAVLLLVWLPVAGQAAPEQRRERLAQVVSADGVVWEDGRHWKSGEWLPSVRMRLKSGVVTLRYSHGAELRAAGPADFTLETNSLVLVSQGNVIVRADDRSIGFTLRTAASDFLDLGTEFGVSVDGDAAEVHVFEGTVVVRPRMTSQIVPLVQKEAGRVEASMGEVVSVPNDRLRFPKSVRGDSLKTPFEPLPSKCAPIPWGSRIAFFGGTMTDRETHLLILAETLRSKGPAAPRLFNLGMAFPLSFKEDDFQRMVLPLRPEYAVLEFGPELAASADPLSPEAFKTAILRLVERLKLAGVKPILEIGYALGSQHTEAQKRLDGYNAALRDVAKQHELRVVDVEAALRKHREEGPPLLVPNGVQISFEGYKVLARTLAQKFHWGEIVIPQTLAWAPLPGGVRDWQYRFIPKDSQGELSPEERAKLLAADDWQELHLPQPPVQQPWSGDPRHVAPNRDRARGFATHLFKSPDHRVLATSTVLSEAAADRVLNVGGNVRRVWLNDALVVDLHGRHTGWHAGKARVPVQLVAGENRILVEAETAFFIGITDEIDWALP